MTWMERWCAGDTVHVVAPFAGVEALGLVQGRTLVLLPSDRDALVWAASVGAELVLPTTERHLRMRRLTAPPPVSSPMVATSLDALHDPVLRSELADNLGGVPWAVLRADLLEPERQGHGGRKPWLESMHVTLAGTGLLHVWASRHAAPPRAEIVEGQPGALRVVQSPADAARAWSAAGRGVAVGTWPGLEARLGESGLAHRDTALHEPALRPWREIEVRLREEERGVDLLDSGGRAGAPGRVLGFVDCTPPLAALVSEVGGAVLVRGESRPVEDVDVASIDAARAALDESGLPFALPGGVVAAELLADLAAVGAIGALRSAFLGARVADAHRFRQPFVDARDDYAQLHRDYVTAQTGWSLAERVALALTDRADADLRPLAAALRRAPAELADLLLEMSHDGLVTAALAAVGEGLDWQARPGPRWSEPAEALAADINALRLARRAEQELLDGVLGPGGCRAVRLREALGLAAGEPCGLCDVCEPGEAWAASLRKAPEHSPAAVAHAPSTRAALELGSLFAGLGSVPSSDSPAAPKRAAGPIRLGVEATEDELDTAVRAAGRPLGAWAQGTWELQSVAGRPGIWTSELEDALSEALLAEAGAGGLGSLDPADLAARRLPRGVLELRSESGRLQGVHRLRPRSSGAALLARLAGREDAGPLARILDASAARERATAWLNSVNEALGAWLDQNPGLPLALALPEPPATGPGWDDFWAAADGSGEALASWPFAAPLHALRLAEAGRADALWALVEARGSARALRSRALLALQPPPALSASELLAWHAEASPEPSKALLALLAGLNGGSRRDWEQVLEALTGWAEGLDLVREAAIAAGALPTSQLSVFEQADASAQAAAVAAALRRPTEAASFWAEQLGGWALGTQHALILALQSEPGPRAQALAAAGTAFLTRVIAAREARAAVVAQARGGDLAGAMAGLLSLPTGAGPHFQPAGAELAELAAVRDQAQGALASFTTPLAAALSAGVDAEQEAGKAALHAMTAAREQGWSDAVLAVLRNQRRRHPADPARAAWLARALLLAGRPADAERAWDDAALLLQPEAALELLWEGVERMLALDPARGGSWLGRLVRRGPAREVARRVSVLASGGGLSPAAARALLPSLEQASSGVWAGAQRAVQDIARK